MDLLLISLHFVLFCSVWAPPGESHCSCIQYKYSGGNSASFAFIQAMCLSLALIWRCAVILWVCRFDENINQFLSLSGDLALFRIAFTRRWFIQSRILGSSTSSWIRRSLLCVPMQVPHSVFPFSLLPISSRSISYLHGSARLVLALQLSCHGFYWVPGCHVCLRLLSSALVPPRGVCLLGNSL